MRHLLIVVFIALFGSAAVYVSLGGIASDQPSLVQSQTAPAGSQVDVPARGRVGANTCSHVRANTCGHDRSAAGTTTATVRDSVARGSGRSSES